MQSLQFKGCNLLSALPPGVDVCLVCCSVGAVSGFGLDYLPAAASSAASDTSWHQAGQTGSSWTNQESPMEESSSTVLLDSLKVQEHPFPEKRYKTKAVISFKKLFYNLIFGRVLVVFLFLCSSAIFSTDPVFNVSVKIIFKGKF